MLSNPLRRAALLAAALVLATAAALAQSVVEVVEGRGEVVRLPAPAASVFVGDSAVAGVQTVSDDTLLLSGVAPGVTNLLALDRRDRLVASLEVVVTASTDAARDVLGSAGPGVRAQGDVAVFTGVARDLDEALAVLGARRELETRGVSVVDRTTLGPASQVNLRVRFVEASRRELQRLGFNLSAVDQGVFRAVSAGALAEASGIAARLSGSVADLDVDVVLRALEERGVVEILSEPTLTTVSGRRATFQSGGEFAVPVPRGEDGVGIDFRSFGVSVDFLPTVLPGGRIAVEVSPQVSFLDETTGTTVAGVDVPGLSVRRAETTVEVGSGQTFAIAGLYEQRRSSSGSGVPGLRRAPVVGGLFDRREARSETRELVIFVTPTLARASDAARPAAPRVHLADTVGFILE